MKYDEVAVRAQLKNEIGLGDIPDDQLKEHTVIINSPVKGDTGMSITADKYVENGVQIYKNAMKQLEDDMQQIENFVVADTAPKKLLELPVIPKQDLSEIRYFDVGYDTNHFVVCINMAHEDAAEYVTILTSNHTFIKERNANDLTGMDNIVSYFQWYNWMRTIEKPTAGIFELDDFEEKIKFSFQGFEGLDEVERFMK